MTKQELIDVVVQQYPRFTPREAAVIVNAVFDGMTLALARGERIEFRGFGSFGVKTRLAWVGRNPRTGAVVTVAAKKTPFFKVSKELRALVDGQQAAGNDDGQAGADV